VQVEGVDFISVPTRDAVRALAWYREALGLPASEYTALEIETRNVTLSFWMPEAQGEQFVPNENGIAEAPTVASADARTQRRRRPQRRSRQSSKRTAFR